MLSRVTSAPNPNTEKLLTKTKKGSLRKSASVFVPDGPPTWRLVQWFVPAFTNGCCIFVCMWFLHMATYFYIMQMTHFEEAYALKSGSANFSMPITGPYGSFSPGKTIANVSFGSLEDPLEGWMGYEAVNIHVLDGVAAAFPFMWMAGTVWTKDLHLWTKVLTCNALLAFGKGCLGMMTTVPDSSGWANCKDRLGDKNIAFLKEGIPNPYTDGFFATFKAIALMEFVGPHHNRFGSGMRYCADMMYSGHTYFTCLYALGLLELTRRQVIKRGFQGWKKKGPVIAVVIVCLLQQAVEVFLVLKSRFHYSMDIAVAVVATLLMYTNGPIVLHAQWWSTHKSIFHAEHLKEEDGNFHAKFAVDKQKLRLEGDLYVPPCCLPFSCLFQGYHHLISTAEAISHGDEIDSSIIAPGSRGRILGDPVMARTTRDVVPEDEFQGLTKAFEPTTQPSTQPTTEHEKEIERLKAENKKLQTDAKKSTAQSSKKLADTQHENDNLKRANDDLKKQLQESQRNENPLNKQFGGRGQASSRR